MVEPGPRRTVLPETKQRVIETRIDRVAGLGKSLAARDLLPRQVRLEQREILIAQAE